MTTTEAEITTLGEYLGNLAMCLHRLTSDSIIFERADLKREIAKVLSPLAERYKLDGMIYLSTECIDVVLPSPERINNVEVECFNSAKICDVTITGLIASVVAQ